MKEKRTSVENMASDGALQSGALFQTTKVNSMDNQFKFFGVVLGSLDGGVGRQVF